MLPSLHRIALPVVSVVLALASACSSGGPISQADPGTGTGTTPPTKPGLGVGETCDAENPCRSGLDCMEGSCEPGHSLPEGSACTISAECEVGLYCDPQKLCAVAGSGEQGDGCASDVDCQSGLRCVIHNFAFVCQPEGTQDVGGSCGTSRDCYGGLVCQSGQCAQLPPGSPPFGVPAWTGESCTDDPALPAMAHFEVPRASREMDFYRLPFPNDIRLDAGRPNLSGHPTPGSEFLGFDPLDPFLRAIEQETTGWSIYPTVVFRFSNNVDWSSFDHGVNPGAVRWVDITPESDHFAFTRGWYSAASSERTQYLCRNWMAFRPPVGEPLRPGNTYAVILSAVGLAADKATPIKRAPDFEAMLRDELPTEVALHEPHGRYQVFRDYLSVKGIAKDSILNAAVFTVGPVRKPGERLASTVLAAPTPTATGWVRCGDAPSPCLQAEGDRGCGPTHPEFEELHALVSLPIFQHGEAPYSDSGGGFKQEGEGYAIARSEQVCLSLTIPKKAEMPEEGWPIVIFAHGTGGSFRSHIENGVAESFAAGSAIAVMGIDQVQHGPRRGASDESPNDLFFNFANPFAAKYNPLQGAADQVALLRFASELALEAQASPTGSNLRIDPEKIAFWGHSQGATQGSIGIPYTETVKAVVLSGNGASLLDSLTTKTRPVNISAALPFVLLDFDANFALPGGTLHPVLSLLQTWIDSADPLAYASLMTRQQPTGTTPRHVFQPYGQKDTYSPSRTQLTYLVAAGMEKAVDDASALIPDPDTELAGVPTASSHAGNLFIAETPTTVLTRRYGVDGYDGHFVAFRNDSAKKDVLLFLTQSLSGQVPQVGP